MTPPLRVVVADDHPVVRDGLRALIASVDDIELVGEAATGAQTLAVAASSQPDVAVVDLHMPEGDGIETTRRLRELLPDARVLILTMFEDDDSVYAAVRAGARGYILKDAAHVELLRAIRAVGQGEAIFGPVIAGRLATLLVAGDAQSAFPQLTGREREVLELMARGLRNPDIARRLVVSPKTVRNHVSNIFAKLHVVDRAEAIVRARDEGLGAPTHPDRPVPPS